MEKSTHSESNDRRCQFFVLRKMWDFKIFQLFVGKYEFEGSNWSDNSKSSNLSDFARTTIFSVLSFFHHSMFSLLK